MTRLIEGLERARGQSLKFAHELSDEQLGAKAGSNSWTIGQVLEHVALVEQVLTANIAKGLESDEPFEEVSTDLESLTQDRSRKVEASEFVRPGAQKSREELLRLLNSSHDAVMSLLTPLTDPETLRKKAAPREHPLFGRLSVYQFIETVGLHELRHIEQIKDILASTTKSL